MRGNHVRPKIGEDIDAVGNRDDEEVDEEAGLEEARVIAGQKAIYQPT